MIERFAREGVHIGLFVGVTPEALAAIQRARAGTVNHDSLSVDQRTFVRNSIDLTLATVKGREVDPSAIAKAGLDRAIALFKIQQVETTPFESRELSDLASHSPLQPQHTDGE